MAKKSSTVHLEQSTWDEIARYQKEYDISSRNDAIERMLVERRVLLGIRSHISPSKNEEFKVDNIKNNDNKDFGLLDEAIFNSDEEMPEE